MKLNFNETSFQSSNSWQSIKYIIVHIISFSIKYNFIESSGWLRIIVKHLLRIPNNLGKLCR